MISRSLLFLKVGIRNIYIRNTESGVLIACFKRYMVVSSTNWSSKNDSLMA